MSAWNSAAIPRVHASLKPAQFKKLILDIERVVRIARVREIARNADNSLPAASRRSLSREAARAETHQPTSLEPFARSPDAGTQATTS